MDLIITVSVWIIAEVDLKDAAKALRKRFACGTSVENKALQL